MQRAKAIKFLKLLSSEELKAFRRFIQSPYYTTNKHLLPLFDYLKKYYPEFESSALSRERAYWKVFEKPPFNAHKVNKLMSELSLLLEQFLTLREFETNTYLQKELRTQSFGKRDAYDLFTKHTKSLLQDIAAETPASWDHYLKKHQVIEAYLSHPSTAKQQNKITSQEDWMENLDLFIIGKKLWLDVEFKARKNFVITDYDFPFLEKILALVKNKYGVTHPTFQTYQQLIELFEVESEEAYYLVKDQLLSNLSEITFLDQKNIFEHLLNFTIRMGNKGIISFRKETLALYKIALNKDYLIELGKINDVWFTNIAFLGAGLKDFKWVKKFISETANYLESETKVEVTKLCLGMLFYCQGAFSKVGDELLNYQFKNFLNEYRARFLLIRSYFELFLVDHSWFSLFLSSIQAFEKFIRRNKQFSKNRAIYNLKTSTYLKSIGTSIYNKKWSLEKKNQFVEKISKDNMAYKSYLVTKLQNL